MIRSCSELQSARTGPAPVNAAMMIAKLTPLATARLTVFMATASHGVCAYCRSLLSEAGRVQYSDEAGLGISTTLCDYPGLLAGLRRLRLLQSFRVPAATCESRQRDEEEDCVDRPFNLQPPHASSPSARWRRAIAQSQEAREVLHFHETRGATSQHGWRSGPSPARPPRFRSSLLIAGSSPARWNEEPGGVLRLRTRSASPEPRSEIDGFAPAFHNAVATVNAPALAFDHAFSHMDVCSLTPSRRPPRPGTAPDTGAECYAGCACLRVPRIGEIWTKFAFYSA